ncbi:hypothetical protein Zmor_018055 [Zophobas morio]|uniref:Uncharacterized protein n=1 Tax=Zophobas morio TaxID=2755281 RepID=A0AA38MD70_9CUCU|nr:hypothetical protein Zmor_018055 [Zophobas morio]
MGSPTTLIIIILHLITTNALESFINTHFPQNEILVIISSNFQNWNKSLQTILTTDRPKIIATPQIQKEIHSTIKIYISVEDDSESLNTAIQTIIDNINTRANFLIILQKTITENELKLVFQTLWSDYIYNVVVLANWTKFVTWYPYRKENHCGKTVNLDMEHENFFKEKIPMKLDNCSVNVTWNEYVSWSVKSPHNEKDPGFAVTSLNTVAEKLNLKLDYLKDNLDYFRQCIEVGNFQPLCDYMTKEKIDVGLTIGQLAQNYCAKIETTKDVIQYPQYFIFPPRKKIRNSKKIFTIFTLEIWSTILLSVLTMAILWKMLNRISYSNSLFYTVQLTFQFVVPQLPRKNLQRFVFFVFLYGITNLNWFYVSQMSSILTEPSYEPQLKTIADILKSTKKLKFFSFFEIHFQNYGNETCSKLMERRDKNSDLLGVSDRWLKEFVESDYGMILGEVDFIRFKERQKLHVVSYDNVAINF